MIKNIMCFGDSNTYGFIAGSGGRYDENTRWTSLLQKQLGSDYRICEEGKNGRTTVYDDDDMGEVNGSRDLEECTLSHSPLDLIILMLGTNDCKARFHASAGDITAGMEQLIQILRESGVFDGTVLVISPIHINEDVIHSEYGESFGYLEAANKSKQLSSLYRELADKYGYHFMDAAEYAAADKIDAIHLDALGHQSLAQAIHQKIKEIGI